MHLVFDIFQAIGLAAAAGVRPFLPALAAGALAAGDVELSFKHTDYAFLQRAPFLLAVVVAVIILTLVERQLQERGAGARKAGARAGKAGAGVGAAKAGAGAGAGETVAGIHRSPVTLALVLAGAAIGALLFAGELARGHAVVWPGFVAGPLCALVGAAASQPLFARVRARLDAAAAQALPLYAEGTALLLAVLSVLAPPVGPIGLALLVWLLIGGRRRGERKYAGLRILR